MSYGFSSWYEIIRVQVTHDNEDRERERARADGDPERRSEAFPKKKKHQIFQKELRMV